MESTFKIFCLLALIISMNSADIYMATNGNDNSGDGSISNPFKTLMKCQDVANAGDIVHIRGGTYTNFAISDSDNVYNYIFKFSKNGITYQGDQSDPAVFDFEFNSKYKMKNNKASQRVAAFYIPKNVQDITFKDFSVTRVPVLTYDEVAALGGKLLTQSECFQSYGKNIHYNRINTYNNQGIGFYFLGTNSYNVAYRCDAYNNVGYDKASIGNADGFGAHGSGARFIECRAWDNSDDNYDCINSYGKNIFDSCWSFRLNLATSNIEDGNGFKVGGFNKDPSVKSKLNNGVPPVHIVKNCISANMKSNGFYANHQPGQAAVWFNNRAYNNKANFDMTEGSETWQVDSEGKVVDINGSREVLWFNIAHKYNTNLKDVGSMYGTEGNLYRANVPDSNNKYNSWNYRDIKMNDNDFLSLDVRELTKARGSAGELPNVNFLKLNPKGTNYEKLKNIEEELTKYTLNDDNGSINKK